MNFIFIFPSHLQSMALNVAILPVVTHKDLQISSPRSTPYEFYRDAIPALLQLVDQMVGLYVLTLSATDERIKILLLTRIELTTSALILLLIVNAVVVVVSVQVTYKKNTRA